MDSLSQFPKLIYLRNEHNTSLHENSKVFKVILGVKHILRNHYYPTVFKCIRDQSVICVRYFRNKHFTNFNLIFTLYSAHSIVGRGNLELKQFFLQFSPNLEALRVEWRNPTPDFASTPQRRNGNINLNKYFISSSGD